MMTRELAAEFKKACEEQECETCPFSVGIYMEGLDYVYYSCDIRKKPRDYDTEKERMKQTKASVKAKKKAERESVKEKKKKDETKTKKKTEKKKDKPKETTENKEKKNRGKSKKD